MRTQYGYAATLMALVLCSAASAQSVPLCPGLTIVGAVNEPHGDYESITTVESVDAEGVNAKMSANVETGRAIRIVTARRRTLLRDMKNARLVNSWFGPETPRLQPGTTAWGPSTAVLRALKTKGTAEIGLVDRGSSSYTADRSRQPNIFDAEMVYPVRRVAGPVPVSVLVNGVKVNLPTIHARGEYMGDVAEWFILDDMNTPLSLRSRMTPLGGGPPTEKQIVKIFYRCKGPTARMSQVAEASDIERSLLKSGRVDVYSIFFDFNSDRIREESDSTLAEIANVLRKHRTWKLSIQGHTDNIGGDRYNLDLSRRRAASVKQALVSRHRIDARRLSTGGAGAAQPRDTNATLEGRARNRRVELVRQ